MDANFKTFSVFREEPQSVGEVEIDIVKQDSSPKLPTSLPKEIVQMLESRIAEEYNAHFAYRVAANWCKNANYKKAAIFFDKGAEEEVEHAKTLQDYLTQWNIIPNIPSVNPNHSFSDLVSIINTIYDVEYKLLLEYSKNALAVLNSHPATFNFLQTFIDIQNKSVAEFSDLLNALTLVDTSKKLDLLVFEDKYF